MAHSLLGKCTFLLALPSTVCPTFYPYNSVVYGRFKPIEVLINHYSMYTCYYYSFLHNTLYPSIQKPRSGQLDLSKDLSRTSLWICRKTGPDQSSVVLFYFPLAKDWDRDRGQDRNFCSPGPVLLRSVPVFWSVPDWSWDRTLQHYLSSMRYCIEDLLRPPAYAPGYLPKPEIRGACTMCSKMSVE